MEILPPETTWLDFEGIMLSEITETEKDKYYKILLIHGIWKKDKNELIDPEDRLVAAIGSKLWVDEMCKGSQKVKIPSHKVSHGRCDV